uniref:Glycerol-3-phosphate dehydrogenase [NAD(+)] n=1 Tax=Strongyloides venezuelensis TaxID=75913 RepID=A0A0K0G0B8_STRVS
MLWEIYILVPRLSLSFTSPTSYISPIFISNNNIKEMVKRIAIIGSGNWGSAIARIIGQTTSQHKDTFDSHVKMWVYEEIVNGEKLSEVINQRHENVKYLPGKKIPENVVAVTDLVETCKDADFLIFVVPHQFVGGLCKQLKGNIKSDAQGISMIKGLALNTGAKSGINLITDEIKSILNIKCSVLMGANLAHEVAEDQFCEATIGYNGTNPEEEIILKKLFHTDSFRISVVKDANTVELCGALKNVVAIAAGISDGLGYGDNTKAAIIRLGLMEITKFAERYYPPSNLKTFFQSCGVADLVTTCYGGRNRKLGMAFAKSDKDIKTLEKEMLNGQSAQGVYTAEELREMLKQNNAEADFPLFIGVDKVCKKEIKPKELIEYLKNHPEHD